MAAAYAAVLSLFHVMENVQKYGRHLISLDKYLIESLSEWIIFFQEFLEIHNSHRDIKEIEILEGRIRDAAHAAEDIIETHIVDRIRDGSTSTTGFLHQEFSRVLEDMDLIKKETMEIQGESRIKNPRPLESVQSASPSRASSSSAMVGSEDELMQVLGRLAGGGSSRQVIPIVGMGGIGKTMLARNAYERPITIQHFDKRAWVTVSQDYSIRDILIGLLKELEFGHEQNISEGELGEKLHKLLFGRRYLIVLDDIWSIEAWEKVQLFLPSNNGDGSRIMITTRLTNVANSFGSCVVDISFLDDDKSWILFHQKVFGPQEGCPDELEGIGKKIVRNCKGLPLSIVVIGGLLARSSKTREYWGRVAEDVNSAINSEDDSHCLKLLYLSYAYLPVHLKPCFLYFVVFREDDEIDIPRLIRLWVAEGFLKPIESRSSEEAAEAYIRDLIDRNLVLVRTRRDRGEIKILNMHDLLREICLREAQKDNFLHIMTTTTKASAINRQRRVVIPEGTTIDENELRSAASLVRSLISYEHQDWAWNSFKLLRVLDWNGEKEGYCLERMLYLVNLRYLYFATYFGPFSNDTTFVVPILTFWNLQTLIIRFFDQIVNIPPEIWRTQQLRHLEISPSFDLPDPVFDRCIFTHTDTRDVYGEDLVLENLQTLVRVKNLRCTREFVERVPNIKKLELEFLLLDESEGSPYCLNNLQYLTKLESLNCGVSGLIIGSNFNGIAFPRSLKELILRGGSLDWEMIGSLPRLQVLSILFNAFIGPVWSPDEGGFPNLKFLEMSDMDLEHWMADATHFPCLERLVLGYMEHLVEIPIDFADIPTLRSIELYYCNSSTIGSAKRIAEEAESFGNEDLRVRATCEPSQRKELERLGLENDNFVLEFH